MVAWSNRPALLDPSCDASGEPFPGAWGIVYPSVWTDTLLVLTIPAGLGVRDIMLSVALQARNVSKLLEYVRYLTR